jgi:dipeptidyl aminopeptidase/acylaminoacyl peptidase
MCPTLAARRNGRKRVGRRGCSISARGLITRFGTALAGTALLVTLIGPQIGEAAFPGPNGRIAFSTTRDGDGEIVTINPDGTGEMQLTDNTAQDRWPAWSPDGNKIAFSSNRDGDYEIYVMNADGTGQVNVSNTPGEEDINPTWSPDGSQIAFVSFREGSADIWRMNADGTGQVNLTSDQGAADDNPSWSPDGTKIAFSTDRTGDLEVYTLDAATGSSHTNITQDPSRQDSFPNWSPDGTQIAYQSGTGFCCPADNDIFRMTATGANKVNLTNTADDEQEPAWSPDGTRIAFWRGTFPTYDVYSVNATDGSSPTNITGDGSFNFSPDWGVPGDSTAPETTIDSGPSGTIGTSSATFTFSSNELASTFECSLDGAGFEPCSSPVTYNGLADGPHTFAVRATDVAQNADTSPATRSFTVDTAVPETAIVSGPSGTVSTSTVAFAFSATEGGSFQCRLDGGAFAPCTSPVTYTDLTDGSHTFEVRATDAVGNTDASPAARTFVVDTRAPQTTIDATIVNGNDITFAFSSDDPNAIFQCQFDGGGFTTCTSPITYVDVAPGPHTFQVRAIDAAVNGDPTPEVRTFTVATATTESGTESVVTFHPTGSDRDADTIDDALDNCPAVANTTQQDVDRDQIGDACDESNGALRPNAGENVVVRVVRGKVFIRYPRGKGPSPFGATGNARTAQIRRGPQAGFVALLGAARVPVGSTVDTEEGRIRLTSAADLRRRTQRAEFYDGVFGIYQRRARRPVTELRLRGAAYRRNCLDDGDGAARTAQRSRKRLGRLWGSGRGRFRTRGRFSAATVRGTVWLTEERCDGTLTRVRTGRVAVFDRARGTTRVVRAGNTYLARATRAALRRLGLR